MYISFFYFLHLRWLTQSPTHLQISQVLYRQQLCSRRNRMPSPWSRLRPGGAPPAAPGHISMEKNPGCGRAGRRMFWRQKVHSAHLEYRTVEYPFLFASWIPRISLPLGADT